MQAREIKEKESLSLIKLPAAAHTKKYTAY